MAENTREIILDTLLSIEKGEQYSNQLIRAVLDKYNYLDARDKAFIKRVTEGTIERQIELDYYLDHFSTVPVRKMKPLVRTLLRMSVYQLLYMDAVPDSAVCNEACKLAVKRKFGNLRGFVNGVLRNLSRSREQLPMPDEKAEPVRCLSVKYSMPEWLIGFWLEEYGRKITATMLEEIMAVHPVSVRFLTRLSEKERELLKDQLAQAGVEIREGAYLPYLCRLEHVDNINALPGFVQDVSSALAVELAGIKKTDFVLDACAAPGGKSILAAEKAEKVLSRDVSAEKTERIRENAQRMQMDNIEIQEWDARCFDPEKEGKADVVLLDVPCSGLGVMGKKRDIKYHITREGMESLHALQREIVDVCSRYVKPGGTFLYSTCTVNPAENEAMVRYIAEELGFAPISVEEKLPEALKAQKRETAALRDEEGKKDGLNAEERRACIQLLPGYMAADGFFIAKFQKPLKAD